MALPQISAKTDLLEFFRQISSSVAFLRGKELACTFAVADGTSKTFAHGLGRAWRGAWVIGNTNASVTFAQTGDPGTPAALLAPERVSVFLSAAADVVVRIWVY